MIRYCPPKSQVWGHHVGRLKATDLVDKALRFLDRHCTIISSEPSELMLLFHPAEYPWIAELTNEIDRTLGAAPNGCQDLAVMGRAMRQCRWPINWGQLPVVAPIFDRLSDVLATGDVIAQCSASWIFAWRDEPPPLRPLDSPGGLFGVYLGKPHRITTMFSFRDTDHYDAIKADMQKLALVELSDRHLRPKVTK